MHPTISVIMPAYNVEKFIQQSIDSVIAQTFKSWELIIIDDGSTDNTASVVKVNQVTHSNIFLIQQKNRKQAAARNAGLRIARGDFIAFLDADDMWKEDKLEVQLKYVDKADVLYCGGLIFSDKIENGKAWKTEFGFFSANEMYAKLYSSNPIPNQAVLMKRSWLMKIGYQNESFEVAGCEDWDYWIRLAKNGATFFGIDDSLFFYRVHPNSTSKNRLKMISSQAHAKLFNLDFSLLDKKIAQEHFSKVLHWLIDRLLEADRKQEALTHIKMLNQVTEQKNYVVIRSLIGRFELLNAKYLIYFANPAFGLRALKRFIRKKIL